MSDSAAKASPMDSSVAAGQSAPPIQAPTGYRVSVLPGTLEVSARVASADELSHLVSVLQANAAIWAGEAKKKA